MRPATLRLCNLVAQSSKTCGRSRHENDSPQVAPSRLDPLSYESLRQQILRRDGWRCQSGGTMSNLEVHHRKFRSRSGTNSGDNLIRNGLVLIDSCLLIACRLSSIDYSRICRVRPVGPSWELERTETDAEVAFSCNCCKNYHLDSRLPRTVKCSRRNGISWEVPDTLPFRGDSLACRMWRESCMNNKNGKWLLAVVALCCLAPAAFATPCPTINPHCNSKAVPEGGSTAIYLLGAGLTCFGAMFLRSRLAKPTRS